MKFLSPTLSKRPCLQQLLIDLAETDKCVRFWNGSMASPKFLYKDILHRAQRVASALITMGLERGERVAIILPTGIDFYDAYFGILFAGGCPTALYPPVRLGRIDHWKSRTAQMLREASCVALLTERRMMGLVGSPALQALPRLGCHDIAKVLQRSHSKATNFHKANDFATVQFSSGSTGRPKAVPLTHANMLSNASASITSIPKNETGHSAVSWLPLYHDMGLIGCLLSAMVAPGDLTLIRPEQFIARPLTWLEALSETKATISVAPNFAFGLCVSRIQKEQIQSLDLSHWTVAMCGAEPVHPNTLNEFARLLEPCSFEKKALTPVYGLAEATLAVTFSSFTAPPKWLSLSRSALFESKIEMSKEPENSVRLMSLGKPLPETIVKIVANQSEVPERTMGEVWIRGPGVSSGYLNAPAGTEGTFDNGWLNTGDLGFLDNNELYLCGRKKDLVIIRGRNYDPSLIEKALDSIQAVRKGCVVTFSIQNEQHSTEQLVVLAERSKVADSKEEATKQTIRAAILSETGLKPDIVAMLAPGTLPRTSSGKLQRSTACQLWQSNALQAPGSAGLSTYVVESARGYIDQIKLKHFRQKKN
ncbi:MAG: fatty acyl-AMP ligase [Planctomycetota bacterium]|nr:fatty acyl-AMP ligase [Planctomycetota bacterium]